MFWTFIITIMMNRYYQGYYWENDNELKIITTTLPPLCTSRNVHILVFLYRSIHLLNWFIYTVYPEILAVIKFGDLLEI